jgi:hypothetical protein
MAMIDWLLSPIDPSRAHDLGGLVSWHGRLMVLAWAVLVPLGIIAARYFKVMPGQDWPRNLDNPLWWHAHRRLHYTAALATLAAIALILAAGSPSSLTPSIWLHRFLGWAVLAILALQITSAWLRGSKGGPTSPAADGSLRGDHYDMTLRRRLFEHVHKFGGLLALLLALAATASGLWQANAPRWMWLVLADWSASLVVIVYWCERHMGALDTYQAIWGPDPALPGNRRHPIGLRVRRRQG